MSRYFTVIFLIIVCCGSISAFELQPEPIQQKIMYDVRFTANTDFDQINNGDTKNESNKTSYTKKYSMPKAVLLSALLPGLGEHYIGQRKKAKYFFAIEAVSWVSVIAFRKYGSIREDDMIRYGAVHANAQLEGKDEEFINMVRFYDDIDQYNSLGRVSDPDRPYLDDTPANHWRWDSVESKEEFASISNSSNEAFRKARFAVGIAVVNRLISVIDVILSTRNVNNRLESEFSQHDDFKYKLKINPWSKSKQVSLTIYTPF